MIAKSIFSVILGMFAWELVRTAIVGAIIILALKLSGVSFSILQEMWDTFGIPGVALLILLYIFRIIRKVERHIGRYENRILDNGK